MNKQLVVVTRRIPEAGLKLLEHKFQLKVNPHERLLSVSELKKFVKGAAGIISLVSDKIDAGLLAAAGKQLKIVANYAVGFDNIDLAAAQKAKVIITNTPGVLTEAVAEHAFSLLMSVARKIVESDKYLRAGKYTGWKPDLLVGQQLQGKVLGILGLGRIGSQVARIGSLGYQMKVIYYNNGSRNKEIDKAQGVGSR